MSVAYYFVILLSTLYFTTSFSFYGFSFYGWVASFFILFPLLKGIKRKSLFIFVVPIVAMLSFFLAKGHVIDDSILNVKLNGVALILFGALYLCAVSNTEERINSKKMSLILSAIIIFHFSVAFIQFLSWYVLGIDIDISSMLGGSGHRAFYYGIYRITGVFDEPAIYSTFMISLCFLRYYLKDKNDWLNYVGICSVMLSFSFAGILISILYLIVSEGVRGRLLFSGLCVVVILLAVLMFYPQILDSILTRLDTLQTGGDGSTNFKYQYLDFWMDNDQRILFGNGMVGFYDNKPKFFESTFDLTFILTTITTFGVVLSLPILLTLYYLLLKGKGWKNQILILIMSLKITSVIFPFFWVFCGLIIAYEKDKNSS